MEPTQYNNNQTDNLVESAQHNDKKIDNLVEPSINDTETINHHSVVDYYIEKTTIFMELSNHNDSETNDLPLVDNQKYYRMVRIRMGADNNNEQANDLSMVDYEKYHCMAGIPMGPNDNNKKTNYFSMVDPKTDLLMELSIATKLIMVHYSKTHSAHSMVAYNNN